MRDVEAARRGADVHEVGRPATSGVDHVQCRQAEACAIDHGADVAIHLHEVDLVALRLKLGLIGLGVYSERRNVGMAEYCVVIYDHLGVGCDPLARVRQQTHTGEGGSNFVARARAAGYGNVRSENVAAFPTAEKAMWAWMFPSGPSHKRSIISPNYTQVGVGVAADASGEHYWCVMFGG